MITLPLRVPYLTHVLSIDEDNKEPNDPKITMKVDRKSENG